MGIDANVRGARLRNPRAAALGFSILLAAGCGGDIDGATNHSVGASSKTPAAGSRTSSSVPPSSGAASSTAGVSTTAGASTSPPAAGADSGVAPTVRPGGTLVVLASGQTLPLCLAVNATGAYWAANGDGTVMKVSLDGAVLTTLASGESAPTGIAVDDTSVYWSVPNGIRKVAIEGGTPVTLGTSFINDNIAVGPAGVYGTSGGDSLVSVPLEGGATTELAPGPGNTNTYGIATFGSNVYWSDFRGSAPIRAVDLQDGGVVTLAPDRPVPLGVAADANYVYWAESGGTAQGGALMKVSRGGGAPVTLASGLTPNAIAIDDAFVYAVVGFGRQNGGIVKAPLVGGPVTVLAAGQSGPSGIAVDGTSVYWTTVGNEGHGQGQIYKLTPK
jgi:hypothetical protein